MSAINQLFDPRGDFVEILDFDLAAFNASWPDSDLCLDPEAVAAVEGGDESELFREEALIYFVLILEERLLDWDVSSVLEADAVNFFITHFDEEWALQEMYKHLSSFSLEALFLMCYCCMRLSETIETLGMEAEVDTMLSLYEDSVYAD